MTDSLPEAPADNCWRPSAELATITAFASMLQAIRRHFEQSGCLEVVTPSLSAAAVSDIHIESFAVNTASGTRYLHTSPEFAMKRLLAAGVGDCYQICRVYRDDEIGRVHNPEFMMLEWYRVGWDDQRLMAEIETLLQTLWQAVSPTTHCPPIEKISFNELFMRSTGYQLDKADNGVMQQILQQHSVPEPDGFAKHASAGDWLDLVSATVIQPALSTQRFYLVHDYPASQAALAKVRDNADGQPVAARFELFFGPLELANGYHELTDGKEQRRRFSQDQLMRQQQKQHQRPLDERLLSAIDYGLPECAGVAVGLERLLMAMLGSQCIEEVVTFAFHSA